MREGGRNAASRARYIGAAYLVYLGVRRLLTREGEVSVQDQQPWRQPLRRVFGQGFVVAILNPKTAIFFVAFLPQFVDPAAGSLQRQLLILGLVFVGLGLCTDSMYALLSGSLGGWLRSSRPFRRLQRYVSGGVYLVLGIAAALSGRPNAESLTHALSSPT